VPDLSFNTSQQDQIEEARFKRKLEELTICYSRMHHIDDHTFKLTTLFYAINSALLVAVISFILLPGALELRIAIAFLGYFSSVASFLVEGKLQLFSWFVFLKRARAIEDEIGFEINRSMKKN